METTTTPTTPVSAAESAPSDFSPEQLQTMAQWAVADGHMSAAQAAAALNAEGLGTTPEALGAGDQTEGIRLEQYVLPTPAGRDMTPDEIEGDVFARELLADAGFPPGLGSAFAAEFDRIATEHESRTPEQRELYLREQREILKQLWGISYEEKLQVVIAFQEAFEAKRPGINEVLTQTGTGYSAVLCEYTYRLAMSVKP